MMVLVRTQIAFLPSDGLSEDENNVFSYEMVLVRTQIIFSPMKWVLVRIQNYVFSYEMVSLRTHIMFSPMRWFK